MKKSILLFVVLFWALGVVAQKFPVKLMQTPSKPEPVKVNKDNKNNVITKVALDSMLFLSSFNNLKLGESKYVYTSWGKILNQDNATFIYDVDTIIEYRYRLINQYDNQRRITQSTYYEIIKKNNQYDTVPTSRYVYNYPANGVPTYFEKYYYYNRDSGQFYLTIINAYYYHGDDNLDSIVYFGADSVKLGLMANVYDSQNRLIRVLNYYTVNDTNFLINFQTYSYNAIGNLIENINYSVYLNDTTPISRYRYVYDNFNRVDSILFYQYNNTLNTWLKLNEKDFTYYLADSIVIISKYYKIDTLPSPLEAMNKEVYVFNQNMDIVSQLEYNYDFTTNTWRKANRLDISYTNYLVSDIYVPDDLIEGFIYAPSLGEMYYGNEANQWELLGRYLLYYGTHEYLPTSQLTVKKLLVYPNPATDFIILDLSSNGQTIVNIYDASGRFVMSKYFDGKPIDVRTLPEGVYTLVLNNANGVQTAKFVKK